MSEVLGVRLEGGPLPGECPDLLDCLDAAVLMLDGSGTIRAAAGATQALGWTAAELGGRRLLELVDAGDRERAARALRGGGGEELGWMDGSGGFRPVTLRVAALAGAEPGAVVVLREARPTRELELQLYAAQRMESVGLFTGGIAHDFNNLLSLVLSYATMARSALPADSLPASDLDEVIDAARRAAGLVAQLLSFSRKRWSREKDRRPATDLSAVVRALGSMLERIVGEHVRIVIDCGPGTSVAADEGQLEQIVMNLAINARDAMPSGGVLTIRSASVGDGAEARVVLTVTDTGEGMSEAARSRVFEPFFSTKGRGGTGLGLTVTRAITRELGGDIDLESMPGLGTTVRVRLPPWTEHAPTAPPAAPAPASGVAHVLVVEDEDALRNLVARVLTGAGFRVTAAPTGADALAWAEALGPSIDLVLLDRVLPDAVGPQLGLALRERCPRARTVYTSGYPDGLEGLADGVVLPKPFDPTMLLDAVRAALAPV